MKRYEKYKPSGIEWIGEIPEHWNIKRLKYMTCNFDNKRIPLSSSERSLKQGKYPYYGATGIIDYVDDYIFNGEYILIGEDGAPFFTKNRDIAIVVNGEFWVNNHAHILEVREGLISKLIAYQLNCVDFSKYITGSTRDKLTQDELNEIKLIYIPRQEHINIVDYLDRKTGQIDDLIAKKQQLIDLLNEEKTAIINHAVTKGLNPNAPMKDSGIPWLGGIPEHWKMKKLKYIAKLQTGEGITSDLIREEGPYPVFGGNGLRGYSSSFTHEGDFVLIGRQGALCGNINYASGRFWASEHAVVATASVTYAHLWLGELLRTMNLNQYSQSAAQPGLSVERIQNLFIPIPPIEEQRIIADSIDASSRAADSIIAKVEKEISLLQEYRTALISEAVTGKIDVRGAC